MRRVTMIPVTVAALWAGLARTQSQPRGKELFERRCTGCHALDRDKEGPRLGGVYGRKAATVSSFNYSQALQDSHIVWSAVTLDKWLADPAQLVPGNDMAFRVENAAERADIIEYLRQQK